MIVSDAILTYYHIESGLYILIIGFLLLTLLLWLCVTHSLKSLHELSKEITKRTSSTRLNAIPFDHVPCEIKPIIIELNQLFKQFREELVKNKRFASDAAHELRTPLAAIKLQAQIAMNAHNPDELQVALQDLIHGVNRSTHIVEQLLTLSRIGPEATLKDMQSVNLESLCAEITAMLVPRALDKHIEIELHATARYTHIHANEISIAILIRNLVDNAIRYTPEGGHVHIHITNDETQHVILSVIDSGIGIAKELRERVFERFYRVLGTHSIGSGLGLAIVKQICDLHEATIALHTPPNDKGLQVDVVFNKTLA